MKITLIDSSLQKDDHTNRLLGLSKGSPHLPERGDRLIEVNITMVKGKQIWDFDKPMLKIADTGSPLNTVLLDTGFDCYKDTI